MKRLVDRLDQRNGLLSLEDVDVMLRRRVNSSVRLSSHVSEAP